MKSCFFLLGGTRTCLHKAFDYVDHNKLWEILKGMGIPDHLTCLAILTCLLRNVYAGQDATALISQRGTSPLFHV